MAGDILTIQLTEEQQKQVRDITGKSVTELNLKVAGAGPLNDEELDQVSGGLIGMLYTGITDGTITGNLTGSLIGGTKIES